MKTNQAMRVLAVASAVLGCSGAFADNMNMTVNANVTGTCKLVSTPTINFGELNQVTAPDLTPAAVNVRYRCTKNTAPTSITLDGNASPFSGSLSNGVDQIPYTVSWTNPTTAGSGLGSTITPVDVPLSPSMLGADYQNVSAGSYTQTVQVTINN